MMDQPAGKPIRPRRGEQSQKEAEEFVKKLKEIDFDAVKQDLKDAMLDSQDFWPADYGHYGPLFVRLAWHCAGSYRNSDGRGGCDGGRQIFDPERSWDDNTNLDKARQVLWPIKIKYGPGLSWGDLIILAGTTAIEFMGGPVLGFCAGRIDDIDGSQSLVLGPTAEQEIIAPCAEQGFCKPPLGTAVVGLIYVNPGGPGGVPDPVGSARSIRDVFSRMSMNDSETVALSGGGHAFGKFHGACDGSPGQRPSENQTHPWVGTCGTGKGADTFTSGFEGPWSETPTKWSNFYFKYLAQNTFTLIQGPSGANEWKATGGPAIPPAPAAFGGGTQDVRMLTSDIALQMDPEGIYQKYVQEFYMDLGALDVAFSHAWYKLVTRDMGPVTRCLGDATAPAQPFQAPLPASPTTLPYDPRLVSAHIQSLIEDPLSMHPGLKRQIQRVNGQPHAAGVLARLAFACANTFRHTDYAGGCNGARVRLSPEKDFANNQGLEIGFTLLQPIKDEHEITWADLIVLAGQMAIESTGGPSMTFCGGRVDAPDDEDLGPERVMLEPRVDLIPRLDTFMEHSVEELKDQIALLGLDLDEAAAIIGAGHSLRAGFKGGQWSQSPDVFDNQYFKRLFAYDWRSIKLGGTRVYKPLCQFTFDCEFGVAFILETDFMLRYDQEFAPISLQFAAHQNLFAEALARGWTKLMNADRFDGPVDNMCNTHPALTFRPDQATETSAPVNRWHHRGGQSAGYYRSVETAEAPVDDTVGGYRIVGHLNTGAMIAGYAAIAGLVGYSLLSVFRRKEATALADASEATPLWG